MRQRLLCAILVVPFYEGDRTTPQLPGTCRFLLTKNLLSLSQKTIRNRFEKTVLATIQSPSAFNIRTLLANLSIAFRFSYDCKIILGTTFLDVFQHGLELTNFHLSCSSHFTDYLNLLSEYSVSVLIYNNLFILLLILPTFPYL